MRNIHRVINDARCLKEKQLTRNHSSSDQEAGHSNRIFCAKFHPKNSNLVVSGGWDNTIQVWDISTRRSVRSLYGPHICGDSIDFDLTGELLLTGSYRKEDPLQVTSLGHSPDGQQKLSDGQVWQFSTLTMVTPSIPFTISGGSSTMNPQSCLLYSSCFFQELSGSEKTPGRPGKYILASGGGGANELKIFDHGGRKVQSFSWSKTTGH